MTNLESAPGKDTPNLVEELPGLFVRIDTPRPSPLTPEQVRELFKNEDSALKELFVSIIMRGQSSTETSKSPSKTIQKA